MYFLEKLYEILFAPCHEITCFINNENKYSAFIRQDYFIKIKKDVSHCINCMYESVCKYCTC